MKLTEWRTSIRGSWILHTLQFGRPEWSFSSSPLDSRSRSQKHPGRNDGSEHRMPDRRTKTKRSFLGWCPKKSEDRRLLGHITKSTTTTSRLLSQITVTVCLLQIWCCTDLIFAGLVLAPAQNLLFDWSSSCRGVCRPLDLEVAGERCPTNVSVSYIFLYQIIHYQTLRHVW